MTEVTPEKLRALADDISPGEAGVFLSASVATEHGEALRAAADEIERLQSDVTELMTIVNAYANEPKTSPEEAP